MEKAVVSAMQADGTERRTEQDVVCGMQVEVGKAADKTEYNGRTYYFCSTACKFKFDARPQAYARYR